MEIAGMLQQVRERAPVVHHLTNWVTIYDCAQVVKTFGASPVMAHAAEEAADMASIASALVLNIGTLTPDFVDAMLIAARRANERNIPIVLDVCGAGATPLRDRECARILDGCHVSVIKGNASEIARVTGLAVTTKGVDSTAVNQDMATVAAELARRRACTVVVTGPVDTIAGCDGRLLRVANGCPLMARVVGTGCMAASVIGTFCAVEPDTPAAAAGGLVCYEIAAEIAAADAAGPGTFKARWFDAIAALNTDSIRRMQRVS
jgi:hydroxyethylthiazole kinase